MYANKCVLKGKRGIEELDHIGAYAVITNRVLRDQGKASKFAVVNTRKAWVDSVYRSYSRALSAMKSLSQAV